MNSNQANEYIKDQLEYYLRLKGIDTNNKFRCLNPNHKDEHPSMSIDRTSGSGPHCKCFACDAYYDTFDLIGIDFGLTDSREIFQKAYDFFSLQVDTEFKTPRNVPERPKNARKSPKWYSNPNKSIYAPRIENISKTEIYDHHSSNNFFPLKVKKESTFLSLKNNCKKVKSPKMPLRGSRINFISQKGNFIRNMINPQKNVFKSKTEASESESHKFDNHDFFSLQVKNVLQKQSDGVTLNPRMPQGIQNGQRGPLDKRIRTDLQLSYPFEVERNLPEQLSSSSLHCVEGSNICLASSCGHLEGSGDGFGKSVTQSTAFERRKHRHFSIDKVHEELLNNSFALNHYENRGLSLDIIKKYKLGYAEGGYNSLLKDYKEFWSFSRKADLYKYVFPYFDTGGKCTYFLTEIVDRSQIDDYNGKYRKISKGKSDIESQIFNERYLKLNTPGVIFICEGIYDALSVEEVGGFAVAFVGTAHRRFLSLCEKYNPNTTFVISLDNDKAGKESAERVMNGLDDLGIRYIIKSPVGKDFNDDLVSNRELFSKYIKDSIKEAEYKLNEVQKEYVQKSVQNDLKEFKRKIMNKSLFLSTGISSLDSLLDGGLYSGLYCVGAVSSLGKTTFCLQIIDNIARSGTDCLVFSLEMSKYELIAKSISRHSLLEDLKQNDSVIHAKTTRSIMNKYHEYDENDERIIESAMKSYSEYADKIYINEGIGNIGVDQIRKEVENHVKIMKRSPVVLVDYLQILSPNDYVGTDKQNVDKSVLELKRLSRDYNIPVIGISSFNRDNYMSSVNMASFKESGAIEYSSDVLIGLQYDGMDWQEGEGEKDRLKRIRELINSFLVKGKTGRSQRIQVKILKNRNGSKGSTCLEFFPMFNYFKDVEF